MNLISKITLALAALTGAAFASGERLTWDVEPNVLIIGELHDNRDHHQRQQAAIRDLTPKAVVFEMLTPSEGEALRDVAKNEIAMKAATTGFHWSNIADYAGVLANSDVIIGAAVERDAIMQSFSEGAAAVFGPDAVTYGLTSQLNEAELKTRMTLQFKAHCDAMPMDMMGGMVEAQRLKDAVFARVVAKALETHGSPVVLITGNGHARMDWGVPVYLEKADPKLRVHSIGQGEDDSAPQGVFSQVVFSPQAVRDADPCAAFQ
ncbi:ChaN family lipoprotein [Ascidiaceihabitans sp.]|uniref:ChaN family lipoprotein n=1 Tax=Ascidiaceihabitans sp. TaxID=1872644 RepID=UPI00329A0D2B